MTISKYGTYGTGYLTEKDFQGLYLSIVTDDLGNPKRVKPISHYSAAIKRNKLELPTLDSVWRDIRNHGLMSPVESERAHLEEEIRAEYGAADKAEAQARGKLHESLLDECEILDYQDSFGAKSILSDDLSNNQKKGIRKSSHELVELSSDNETPKRVRDGEFGKNS